LRWHTETSEKPRLTPRAGASCFFAKKTRPRWTQAEFPQHGIADFAAANEATLGGVATLARRP